MDSVVSLVSLSFSNQFLSANNTDESDRLKFYDSDGEYIDYISLDKFGPPFEEVGNLLGQLFLTNEFYGLTDVDMAELLAQYFHDIDDIIYTPDFEELYKIYSEDYINRIGSCALIIKE